MAEVLIERLLSAVNQIPQAAVPGCLAAFAANLDDLAFSSADELNQQRVWEAAKQCVELLLKRLTQPEERAQCVRGIFTNGQALGWLTSLLRSEIFAHGLHGDRAVPEIQRLLTPGEFADVLAIMLRRFAETSPEVVMRGPNLMSLLYGWQQGGKTDDTKHWVQRVIQTDEGLLNLLSKVRGYAASSTLGVYFPLNKRDLINFLDYDEALLKIQKIHQNESASPEQRKLAKELLLAFQQDSSDF